MIRYHSPSGARALTRVPAGKVASGVREESGVRNIGVGLTTTALPDTGCAPAPVATPRRHTTTSQTRGRGTSSMVLYMNPERRNPNAEPCARVAAMRFIRTAAIIL